MDFEFYPNKLEKRRNTSDEAATTIGLLAAVAWSPVLESKYKKKEKVGEKQTKIQNKLCEQKHKFNDQQQTMPYNINKKSKEKMTS